jgi:hypothetical protein
MKKILIIDEKTTPRDDGTGFQFLGQLPDHLAESITLETNLANCVEFLNENEVRVIFNLSDFEWVFYHDSYQEKNLDAGHLESFKSKVPNLIVFSGGKEDVGYSIRSTTRELLFSKLQNALEAWLETGYFPVRSVCDYNISFYHPVIEKLEDFLMDGDKEGFLKSMELIFLLKKLNYSESVIQNRILPRYTEMTIIDLFKKISDWKSKTL